MAPSLKTSSWCHYPISSWILLRNHAMQPGSSKEQPLQIHVNLLLTPQTHLPPPKPPLHTQSPLRTRHLPLPPRDPARRLPHRNSRRLERTLRPMVIILPPQAVHMQRDPRGLRKALQAVRDHLGAEVADLLALQAQVHDAVGPVRQVDDGAAEGLVQRRVGVAEAGQAGGRAEGAREGVA